MPVEIRQPMMKLYGEAAYLTGQAARLREEEKAARAEAQELRSFQARQELEKFQSDLSLERAKFNYNLDFERDKRARLWELEKMEMASRIDFEEQERKRIEKKRKLETALAKIKEAKESGIITEDQADKLTLKASLDFSEVDISDKLLFPPEEKRVSEVDIARAGKYLKEYEEPGLFARGFTRLTGLGAPSEIERRLKEHYENVLQKGLQPEAQPDYSISGYELGEIIVVDGKRYVVTGIDADGMPLVDLIE